MKKAPNHGDTLCLRGLHLFHLGRKVEGYEQARLGLRYALKSHVSWHIYGLMYRADRNYEEAAKCYTNALKFDPENMQILRDLASIQTQLRQYDALVETRLKILSMRPTLPVNWVSLAVSLCLAKDSASADLTISQYLEFIQSSGTVKPKDLAHLYNFKLTLHEYYDVAGMVQELQELPTIIADMAIFEGWRAKYSGCKDDAYKLLDLNHESGEAIELILKNSSSRLDTLRQLVLQHQDSIQLRLKLLGELRESEFVSQALDFLRSLFNKGCSSGFQLFKVMAADHHMKPLVKMVIKHLEDEYENNIPDPKYRFATAMFVQAFMRHEGLFDSCGSWLEKAKTLEIDHADVFMQEAKLLQVNLSAHCVH